MQQWNQTTGETMWSITYFIFIYTEHEGKSMKDTIDLLCPRSSLTKLRAMNYHKPKSTHCVTTSFFYCRNPSQTLSTYFSKEANWDLDLISVCFLLLYIHMVLIVILLFSEVGSLWESWRRKAVQLINQNLWLLNFYHSLMTPVQEFYNIFLCCMFSHSILTCTDFFLHLLNSFILFYLKPFTF